MVDDSQFTQNRSIIDRTVWPSEASASPAYLVAKQSNGCSPYGCSCQAALAKQLSRRVSKKLSTGCHRAKRSCAIYKPACTNYGLYKPGPVSRYATSNTRASKATIWLLCNQKVCPPEGGASEEILFGISLTEPAIRRTVRRLKTRPMPTTLSCLI